MKEDKSYLHKIVYAWGKLWSKVSWTEVVFICIFIIASMLYIKVNVATYHVECDDGSIYEIHHGTNFVCDQILEFNSWTGVAQTSKIINFNFENEYNYNNINNNFNNYNLDLFIQEKNQSLAN